MVNIKFSPRIYMDLMARKVGQGPLHGEEIARSVKTLDALQSEMFRYTDNGCMIAVGLGNDGFEYCGGPCNSRNHIIQQNGVLDSIAEPSHNNPHDLRVYRLAPDLKSVRDHTASRDPESGRRLGVSTYPLWKVTEFTPTDLSTADAAVGWFVCDQCDNVVFALIDEYPDFHTRRLPLAFDEQCVNWSLYQSVEEKRPCPEHWLFLLAYRTFLFRLNRVAGLLSAIRSAREEQQGRQVAIAVEILDSLLRRVEYQVNLLRNYRLMFESKRLGKQNYAMHHIVLEISPSLPVASSDFMPVRDLRGKWAYVAIHIYPQTLRSLALISYFIDDRLTVSRAMRELVRGIEQETSSTIGPFLAQVLREWDNVYVHPGAYKNLEPELLRGIQRSRSDTATSLGFGSMFDLIESTPAGARYMEQIRRGPLSSIDSGDVVDMKDLKKQRLRPSHFKNSGPGEPSGNARAAQRQ